ncbi:MAG TPA: DUF2267 domain-containing protein [Pseudonocardia sp.]|uniref:DUF2267 domain-containing protein n=1 Tax=Pseudonocardia sp. TaxID=60912 RepID=UPI002ED966B0
MIDYEDFVAGIRERTGLADARQVREVTWAVLASVAPRVGPEPRRELSRALPATMRAAVVLPGRREPELAGPDDMVGEISQRLGRPTDQARALTRAVLAQLCEVDPDTAGVVSRALGPRFAGLFEPVEQPAAGPAPLTEQQMVAALGALTNWAGDNRGITRTVVLPADRHLPLIHRVRREATALNHRAMIAEHGETITFSVCAPDSGDVTKLDIKLAARIDSAVIDMAFAG